MAASRRELDDDTEDEQDDEADDEDADLPLDVVEAAASDEDEDDAPLLDSEEEDDGLQARAGPDAELKSDAEEEEVEEEQAEDGTDDDDLPVLDDLIGNSSGFSAGTLEALEAAAGSDSEDEPELGSSYPGEEAAPQYEEPPSRQYALGDLLQAAGLGSAARQQLSAEQLETAITDVQFDPRKVNDGCLFVCVHALHYDGHDFTECSVENGAAAFVTTRPVDDVELPEGFPVIVVGDTLPVLGKLASAFCDNPSEKLAVVGVTGSAGKTTTSWLIRSIFEELGQLTGMLGSLEYAIAEDRLTDDGDLWEPPEEDPTLKLNSSTPYHMTEYKGKYGVSQSTPNALAMHKILAGVADRGGASAVIECTTTGLEEGRTDEVDFDVAVFTNATEENLFSGGGVTEPETMDAHVAKMARLFGSLNDPDRQRAVINVDDPYADVMKQAGISVPVVTYATKDRDADVLAEKVKMSAWETDILIRTPLGRMQVITPLIGMANVYNVLAAIAVGISLNINLQAIVAGIEAVDVVPGRTEIIDEGQKFPVIVDSAATPAALTRLLDGVREAGARRILTVFGAEGHSPQEQRPILGEILHYKSDFVFVTNNNPRFESPTELAEDLCAGFPEHIHRYEAVHGQPHWLRDVMSPGPADDQHPALAMPTQEEMDRRIMNQGLFRRAVVEDRYTAIRTAIGTAQERDAVVIVGKGAQDYQEYGDPDTGHIQRGWFDDRVEARNALSKLPMLEQMVPDLDRKELPWLDTEDTDERPERIDVLMGTDTRQFKS